MTVSIIELSNGGASLEFAPQDAARVRAAIRTRFGGLRRKWFALSARVSFGGEAFAFQNAWSDPCLISTTPRGAAMLRAVAEDLRA